MEILNYEGLLKYNEALHKDLLTNYASVLDINAVELDIETLKTNKVDVSDMMTPDSANGHAYVDLGLPSGTLWATMNVGASSETDYGNYYKYGKGAEQYDNAQANYSGTEDPLDSNADTASVVWGGSWHMPTRAQMQELTANTTYEWTTINGVNGGKFTATNGNYVFFPAAGNWNYSSQYDVDNYGKYWGSSPNGGDHAYYLSFSNGRKDVSSGLRRSGFPVRGVIDGPIATPGPKYATKEELNTVAGTKQDVIDCITTAEIEELFSEGDIPGGHEADPAPVVVTKAAYSASRISDFNAANAWPASGSVSYSGEGVYIALAPANLDWSLIMVKVDDSRKDAPTDWFIENGILQGDISLISSTTGDISLWYNGEQFGGVLSLQ